jgi:hypothetical protein
MQAMDFIAFNELLAVLMPLYNSDPRVQPLLREAAEIFQKKMLADPKLAAALVKLNACPRFDKRTASAPLIGAIAGAVRNGSRIQDMPKWAADIQQKQAEVDGLLSKK